MPAIGLDAVSFLFAQVLTQIDYLYESKHLSQENYATIAAALLQATPPGSPATPAQAPSTGYFPAQPVSQSPSVQTPSAGSSADASLVARPPKPAAPSTSNLPPPVRKPGSLGILKFKSTSENTMNFGHFLVPTPSSQAVGPATNVPAQPTSSEVGGGEEQPVELGKVNRRIRKALKGGFLLGQVVDQALAVTPFFPETLRESLVERVEENAAPFVERITDPRQQAIAREHAARIGSSAWKIASGKGGGTSRASQKKATDADTTIEDEGSFRLITVNEGRSPKDAPLSVTSIHTYSASADIAVTAVITTSFLASPSLRDAERKAREAGLAPELLAGEESFYTPAAPARTDSTHFSGKDW